MSALESEKRYGHSTTTATSMEVKQMSGENERLKQENAALISEVASLKAELAKSSSGKGTA